MDASYKIQRGIHVHLIQFFMCPEFWVHITQTHSIPRRWTVHLRVISAGKLDHLSSSSNPRKPCHFACANAVSRTVKSSNEPFTSPFRP